jgi:hypothetical protein
VSPVLAPDAEVVVDVAVALSLASGANTADVESVAEATALDVALESEDLQHISHGVPELSCCD